MKKKLFWISALILAVVTALLSMTFFVGAEEPIPAMSIDYCNLSFRDSVCVKYAVKIENTETASVLVWETPESEYVYGTQDAILGSSGTQTIKGGTYYVFDYEALAAKQMTDEIYARAYCRTAEGEEYYSPVKKFSVLEYAMTVLADPTTAEPLANLMRAMLDYGAAAQSYTNYQTDRLANQSFYRLTVVGGTLADGMTTGLYPAGASVTLVAPETDAEGKPFRHWENSAGAVVHEEVSYALTTLATDETYTAVYGQTELPSPTELLLFTELADGTYSVKANSEATLPSAIAIPATYNGKAVTEIEASAFEGLTQLTSVTLPAGIKTVGEKAFSGCTALESLLLPDTVTTIGIRAFHNCATITEFTVPASVTSIGTQIFYGCNALTKVYYNSSYADQNNPFLSVKNLTEIVFGGTTVPAYILYESTYVQTVKMQNTVEAIGNHAFYGCTRLTDMNISNSVTDIGKSAFYNCTSLTNIIIPNSVTSIGESAFRDCTGLTSVTIGNGVTSIGDHAFSYTGVKDIVIPDSVTSIGYQAFGECLDIETIMVGTGVKYIEDYAFALNSRIASLEYDVYVKDIEAWNNISYSAYGYSFPFSGPYGCHIRELHILDTNGNKVTEVVLPDTISKIEDHTFRSCTGLTSITIPDSVTSIGSYAFANCTGLTSVTIPDSVTSIGTSAFNGCTGLTSITIPDSVTSIGDYALSGCTGLTSITIPDSVTSISLSGCTGLTSITIPDSVTSISLSGCTNLTSITIPDSVTSISLSGCTGLTSVTIPDSVTSIGTSAFNGCTGLTSITIPDSVTSIGESAFSDCTGLTSITIPDSVTSIGNRAFYNCTGLKDVYISDVEAWLNISFGDDTSLPNYYGTLHLLDAEGNEITELVIPDGVTSIGDYAFKNCTGLTSITIPDSVTSIGRRAFENCTGLTSVTIPDSVTSIGSYAFYKCTSLTRITYEGTMEQWAAVTKGSNWKYKVPATEVICSDGEVAL